MTRRTSGIVCCLFGIIIDAAIFNVACFAASPDVLARAQSSGHFQSGLSVENIFSRFPEREHSHSTDSSSTTNGKTKRGTANEYAPQFVSSNPNSHVNAAGVNPQVRINPEAPGPFKAMAAAFQSGDRESASLYADQFVQYMLNVMYEVRALTKLIGEAMVRKGVLGEEDWVGVEQYMDREFALARKQEQSAIRPNHEESLKRVEPDSRSQAHVFFFFSLESHFAREMAKDVERLAQAVREDRRVAITALALGVDEEKMDWLGEFVSYTGLSLPIRRGDEAAKAFRIRFVPTVVVIAPNSSRAYVRTGQQSFVHLYQFVRAVQGLPIDTSLRNRKQGVASGASKHAESRTRDMRSSSRAVVRARLREKGRSRVLVERF